MIFHKMHNNWAPDYLAYELEEIRSGSGNEYGKCLRKLLNINLEMESAILQQTRLLKILLGDHVPNLFLDETIPSMYEEGKIIREALSKGKSGDEGVREWMENIYNSRRELQFRIEDGRSYKRTTENVFWFMCVAAIDALIPDLVGAIQLVYDKHSDECGTEPARFYRIASSSRLSPGFFEENPPTLWRDLMHNYFDFKKIVDKRFKELASLGERPTDEALLKKTGELQAKFPYVASNDAWYATILELASGPTRDLIRSTLKYGKRKFIGEFDENEHHEHLPYTWEYFENVSEPKHAAQTCSI